MDFTLMPDDYYSSMGGGLGVSGLKSRQYPASKY